MTSILYELGAYLSHAVRTTPITRLLAGAVILPAHLIFCGQLTDFFQWLFTAAGFDTPDQHGFTTGDFIGVVAGVIIWAISGTLIVKWLITSERVT